METSLRGTSESDRYGPRSDQFNHYFASLDVGRDRAARELALDCEKDVHYADGAGRRREPDEVARLRLEDVGHEYVSAPGACIYAYAWGHHTAISFRADVGERMTNSKKLLMPHGRQSRLPSSVHNHARSRYPSARLAVCPNKNGAHRTPLRR